MFAEIFNQHPAFLMEGFLLEMVPIKIWGGCCGTNGRHMEGANARLITSAPEGEFS